MAGSLRGRVSRGSIVPVQVRGGRWVFAVPVLHVVRRLLVAALTLVVISLVPVVKEDKVVGVVRSIDVFSQIADYILKIQH